MKPQSCWAAATVLCLGLTWADAIWARPAPVLLISIDGLRPGDVLDAERRGLKVPALRRFVLEGAYASGVHGVLPTLTYPSHTTLLTGVAPARHGIVANLTFDPQLKNDRGWYWYAADVRVPTLWDAAHSAGLRTANVNWPVSVGARVDYNLPQYWRTGTTDDRKLLKVLATPGLIDALERELGPYADGIAEDLAGDENRTRFALDLIETRKPDFMTMYIAALDHEEHLHGPDSPQAHAVLERIDALVARLVAAMQRRDPHAVICVVSDHGFAPLAHDVNLVGAFVEAGLIQFDQDGRIESWDAFPWHSAGTAAIVLRDRNDSSLHARVAGLLERLQKNPDNGIAAILDRNQIYAAGGNPEAEFMVNFTLGYEMGSDPKAPMLSASVDRGMHGYLPTAPQMNSTFLLLGSGIPAGRALGEIDMRDIAPTLAHLLGIKLPGAEGKPVSW